MGKAYYDTNSIEIKHYQIGSFNQNINPVAPHELNTAARQHGNTAALQSRSALTEALDGLKIAHLSDLHVKRIGFKEQELLNILKGQKPDLIFITGDLIGFKSEYEPVMLFLHQLHAPLGIYAVLGNTEYSNENGSCILCHEKRSARLTEKRKITFLRNSHSTLNVNGKLINIIGLDDPVNKKSDFNAALKGIHPNSPLILLAHSPEIFEDASNAGVDLLFCGHTHGGQIFITKFLRKVFPLIDPALEFLEGFFQKGKTLMYVSSGFGTSFLPFRLGIKPEVTFFQFGNGRGNSNNLDQFAILNNPPQTVFTGMSVGAFLETFNMFSYLNPFADSADNNFSDVLFDFESEADLRRLNWQCHKWFELSDDHATSGRFSLKAILPPGRYSGISFQGVKEDWSTHEFLRMDVFNPSRENFVFHIRIDDNKSGWEYANRFDMDISLKPGMNHISIPTQSIRTNIRHYPLNLNRIKRMMSFIPNNVKKREIYIDHIRLE